MKRGWWRYWRKMQDDPLWEPKRPRTKYEAWLDLISRAKGRPGRELIGYSMIPLNRGQLIFSVKGLATGWKWSRDKTRRFLESQEREGRIRVSWGYVGGASKPDTQTDTPYSIITICNYEKYNPLDKKPDTQTDTKPTPTRHSSDTSNKEIKKEDTYIAEIEEIFDAYSKSITQVRSRSDSRKSKIRARLKECGKDYVLRAIENYRRALDDPNHYFTHRFPIEDFMTPKNVERFYHMDTKEEEEIKEMPIGSGR